MIGYLSSNGHFTFNRMYVLGFQFFHDGNLALLSSDATRIRVGYLWPFLEFDFVYLPRFYAPNTNSYSLDHAFDYDASGCLFNGSPTASGVFSHFLYSNGEKLPRVQIDFGFTHTHDLFVDLPSVTSPWFVRP